MNSASHVHRPLSRSFAAVFGGMLLSSLLGCDASPTKGAVVQPEPTPKPAKPVEPAEPAAPAPGPEAVAIDERGPGRLALRVSEEVALASPLQLETLSAGEWQPVRLPTPLALPTTGTTAADKDGCRKVASGAVLPLPTWEGKVCDSSTCTATEARYRSGSYRLVVKHCAPAAAMWVGAPFEMPGTPDGLPRFRATANVSRVMAFRLNPKDRQELKAIEALPNAKPERVAGYAVVPDGQFELSPEEVGQTVAWLRSSTAFAPQEGRRRCRPGRLLGMRFERELSGLPPEVTELALDPKCKSLLIGMQQQSGFKRHQLRIDGDWPAELQALDGKLPGGGRKRRRR